MLKLTASASAENPGHAARILRAIADHIDADTRLECKLPYFQTVNGSVTYDWKLDEINPLDKRPNDP